MVGNGFSAGWYEQDLELAGTGAIEFTEIDALPSSQDQTLVLNGDGQAGT